MMKVAVIRSALVVIAVLFGVSMQGCGDGDKCANLCTGGKKDNFCEKSGSEKKGPLEPTEATKTKCKSDACKDKKGEEFEKCVGEPAATAPKPAGAATAATTSLVEQTVSVVVDSLAAKTDGSDAKQPLTLKKDQPARRVE